jgi:hypothetical protein
MSLVELSQLCIDKLQQKHNSHICRIFKAALDSLVDVVYVKPYYYQILEMGRLASCRDRIHLEAPASNRHLSATFSTSKLLIYSPKTVARIRRLIAGRVAYIVPRQAITDNI